MNRKEWMEEADRWFKQAEHNREVAAHDRAGGFHNAACFWAHQTAEAALKAVFYAHGLEARGHSVAELVERASQLGPDFIRLVNELAPLDQYYIPTRYPNGLAAPSIPGKVFNEQDSARALDLADKALKVVREQLKVIRLRLQGTGHE